MQKIEALKSVFGNSGHYYLLTTDLRGYYTYVNANYAKALEHLSSDLLNTSSLNSMHPDDFIHVQRTSHLCINDPEKLIPIMIRKHDGKGGFMYTQWEFSAILDEENKQISGICCLGYNVTQAVEEQNRLLETNNLVAEKDEALKAIGYIQSHRIRKQVANIQGLTSLLKKMQLETGLENIISMIQDSSYELDEVIEEVVGHVQKNS